MEHPIESLNREYLTYALSHNTFFEHGGRRCAGLISLGLPTPSFAPLLMLLPSPLCHNGSPSRHITNMSPSNEVGQNMTPATCQQKHDVTENSFLSFVLKFLWKVSAPGNLNGPMNICLRGGSTGMVLFIAISPVNPCLGVLRKENAGPWPRTNILRCGLLKYCVDLSHLIHLHVFFYIYLMYTFTRPWPLDHERVRVHSRFLHCCPCFRDVFWRPTAKHLQNKTQTLPAKKPFPACNPPPGEHRSRGTQGRGALEN